MRKTLVRAVVFTALFPGTVTVLIPAMLLAEHWPWPVGVRGAGIGLIVLGAGIYLSCAA